MKRLKPMKVHNKGKRRRKVRKGRVILAGVLVVLLCFMGVSAIAKAIRGISSLGKEPASSTAVPTTTAKAQEPKLYEIDGRINVLVMGVDSSNPGKEKDGVYYPRSDTMMVMSLDTKSNTAFMLSIPRDIKITIGGHTGKLNAVYRRGGPQLAIQAAEKITGIKINKYMVISYQAVEKTVDDLGGIDFNVPMDMDYDDVWADPELHIHLKQGEQLLDGDKAMQLLRFRHGYKDEDLGRMRVQQDFIKTVVKKALSPSSVVHIPAYIDTLMKYVSTDLNIIDMLTYAHYAQKLSLDQIERQTLAGDWSSKTMHFEVEKEKAVQQIKYLLSGNYQKEEATPNAGDQTGKPAENSEVKVLPPDSEEGANNQGEEIVPLENYKPETTPTIYIDNGSGRRGAAGRAEDILKINDLVAKSVGNAADNDQEKTVIYYKDDERLAHKIQMLLEAGEVWQADSIPGKKGYTIYVVIGKDFKR